MATTHASWTPTTCYFAFRVDDPRVVGNQTRPLGQPWLDDAVAVYLNLQPDESSLSPSCVRVVISAAGGATVQRWDRGDWRDQPEWFHPSPKGIIRYGVKVLGTLNGTKSADRGYLVELGLSWELLGIKPPVRAFPDAPNPTIGLALVCYQQGDTHAVSYWPQTLTAVNLADPGVWGKATFLQTIKPEKHDNNEMSIPLTPNEPVVDGVLDGYEWLSSDVVTFPLRTGAATASPAQQPQRALSLLMAWYRLDPFTSPPVHQPLVPNGPWGGASSPAYHLAEIRAARQTGIEAFALVMDAAPARREVVRTQLLAFRDALTTYSAATSTLYQTDAPLLAPAVDLAGVNGLSTPDEQRALRDTLDAFFGMIPPQYRVTVTDAAGYRCVPVLLTAPLMDNGQWPADKLTAVADDVAQRYGVRLGWLLDSAWGATAVPHLLARCPWNPQTGWQTAEEGSLSLGMLTPGLAASRTQYLPARVGEVYDNGWLQARVQHPELLLVRSWNEYGLGTEIAATRPYGAIFLDSTRVASLHYAGDVPFPIRIVAHTLPPVVRPARTYPVEIVLKNASITNLTARAGYRVSFRVLHDGQTCYTSPTGSRIVLPALGTARVQFDLRTGNDHAHGWAPGAYQIQLNFLYDRLANIQVPLMTTTLGTLLIPFTVGTDGGKVQTLASALPAHVPTRALATATYMLRNLGERGWSTPGVALHLQWQTEEGTPLPEEETEIALPHAVPPGEIITINGRWPAAPRAPGWYYLVTTLTGMESAPVPVARALVAVTAVDLSAAVETMTMPETITGTAAVVATLTVRNVGRTLWNPEETHVVYQWLTWYGEPIPHASGTVSIPAVMIQGQAERIYLPVAPPPGAGPFRCAFGVLHGETAIPLSVEVKTGVQPIASVLVRPALLTPVSLTESVNGAAACTDISTERADVDGVGNAFPLEEFLPDADQPPLGYPVRVPSANSGKAVFAFGAVRQGMAPLVHAKGQTIPLPETAATALHLAAFATTRGVTTALTVQYTDGSTATLPLVLSSWLAGAEYEEALVLHTRYLRTPKGDNWLLRGNVYAYRLPLDRTKKVKALVLPDQTALCICAATLEAAE